MNDIYSFYQLISKFNIEIPIIQRDYAQGRKNPKAEEVRKSMVRSMVKSVTEDGSPLFFDFVYGRIDGNKFIPFDGQQRLTTLFLFHKYVFEKRQPCIGSHYNSKCICNDILLRFSYATRQSSREFCEQLVSNSVIPSNVFYESIRNKYLQMLKDKQESEFEKKADKYVADKTDWMSSYIKNQSWFYSDWEKDPTIMGMLVMLDEIHNQFSKQVIDDYKTLAEKLTSGCSCPITFHFVDMDGEHKLSDETYVKMNARGKALTPFENFKASLEQYLEINKKNNSDNENDSGFNGNLNENERKLCAELLNRFKGVYNGKCYTGVDGTWLDLFWDVVNKEKKLKALPDDAMMSFFNRHFMNVWRCWYEKKIKEENESKSEKYNSFNDRIVEEMPLYPTKDDFVPWEIYQYVLDNCGIDECLSPIFNIWDELCKGNNINEDCQAVWNRGTGKDKWDLYVGEKKDNRETYPSRVAFYALLRYYGIEKHETSLSQWMRIVWNIIENSTIDSSGTYQAALRLINKLSEKCYDINYALANHFEDFQLGSQYHAQDQVHEEVVKATKIIENPLWEKKIEKAEECPYLKGKIWVLFQDGDNTELKQFKLRLDLLNAIIENPDEYYLPKILLSYYDKQKPETTIELKKSEKDWKNLLTDNKKGLFSCFQKIQSDSINQYIRYQWIKDLSTTQLLNNSRNDAKKIGSHGNRIVLWGTSGCRRYVFANEVWGNVIIGNHRTLLMEGDFDLQDKNIVVPQTNFVSYFDVNFKYNNNFFQWYGNPNDSELDVYLMNGIWCDYKRRSDFEEGRPDKDNYYCFEVDDTTTLESFKQMLNKLIKEAEAHNQPCYNECQNK